MFEFHIHLSEGIKTLLDWGFASVTVASILAWIPHVTAVVALVWWLIRLYETKTIQRLLGKEPKDGDE